MKKIIYLGLVCMLLLCSCSDSTDTVSQITPTPTITPTIAPTLEPTPVATPIPTPETTVDIFEELSEAMKKTDAAPNSSDMELFISRLAKEKVLTIKQAELDQALKFIKVNVNNFFKDNQTMERALWCGFILDYNYDDSEILSKIGSNTTMGVKYIYRKVEDVGNEDSTTKLHKLRELLATLN